MLNIYETSVNTDIIQLLKNLTEDLGNYYILAPADQKDSIKTGLLELSDSKALLGLNILTIEEFLSQSFLNDNKTKPELDNFGRVLLLSELLKENKSQLKVFSGLVTKLSFAEVLANEIRTFLLYDVCPDDILQEARRQSNKLLADKLYDVALIYDKFLSACDNKFTLDRELYNWDLKANQELLRSYTINIVAYDLLVPLRQDFIINLAKQASRVNLIFTRANVYIGSQALTDFTIQDILSLSDKHDIEYQIIKDNGLPQVNKPSVLEELSQSLEQIGYKSSKDFNKNIICHRCASTDKEAEAACYYIKSLIDNSFKPSEIMILSNNQEELPTNINEFATLLGIKFCHKSHYSLNMLEDCDKLQSFLLEILEASTDNELYSVKNQATILDFVQEFKSILRDKSLKTPKFLNSIVLAIGERKFDPQTFKEYFNYGASILIHSQEDLSGITYFNLAKAPIRKVKSLILLGVNQSEFPSDSSSGKGIFSRYELSKMNSVFAHKIARNQEIRDLMPRANLLRAIGNCTDTLYISYSENDQNGNPKFGSQVIEQLNSIFTDELTVEYHSQLPYFALYNNEKDNEITIKHARDRIQPSNLNQEIFDALYKSDSSLILSASRFATFFDCPFKYFVSFGLLPEINQDNHLDQRDTGNIYHLVLKELASKILEIKLETKNNRRQGQALDSDDLNKRFQEEFDRIINETFHNYRDGLFEASGLGRSRLRRIKRNLATSAEIVFNQISGSSIEDIKCEIGFGRGKPFPGFSINLDSGTQVEFSGQIDRVDIFACNGEKYFSLIDYKSSEHKFDYWYAMQGYRVQLFIYALALMGLDYLPGGIFYFNILDTSQNCTGKKIPLSNAKQLRGYWNSDFETDEANEEYFNPELIVGLSRNKVDSDTLEEWFREILAGLKQNLERLINGDISISPVCSPSKILPCSNCPYYSICLRNPIHEEQMARLLSAKPKN